MGAVRVVMVLVGLAAIAAGVWFFMTGRSELAAAEDVMAKRWDIWQKMGAVDDTKLDTLRKDPKWTAYKPTSSSIVATPFHHEFGFYLHRTEVQTTRAAMALGGVGLLVVLLAVAAKPRSVPAA